MTEPLVSVIMPAYNAEKYVQEAIESVINQTYKNWELLVINDGSIDDTEAITEIFANKDSRVKLFKNDENKGLIYTRNRGLDLATGKYIANLDSDDIAMPNRFEVQISFMESNSDYVMCGSACELIDFEGKSVGEEQRIFNNESLYSLLVFSNYFINSSVCIRKDFAKGIKYETGFDPAEDYRYFSKISEKYKIGNSLKKLIKYRVHGSNISTLKKKEQLNSISRIQKDLIQKLGIKPTREELLIHENLANETNRLSESDLLKIEEWLLKLSESNSKSVCYNQLEFNKWCAFFYKRACLKSKLGLLTYFKFKQSVLSKFEQFSLTANLSFFVKSILKKA